MADGGWRGSRTRRKAYSLLLFVAGGGSPALCELLAAQVDEHARYFVANPPIWPKKISKTGKRQKQKQHKKKTAKKRESALVARPAYRKVIRGSWREGRGFQSPGPTG